MKIGICDDEEYYIKQVESNIEKSNKKPNVIEIRTFMTGEELIECYSNNVRFDVLFLDVELNGINGIEVAEFIRNLDKIVEIIFLTSHEKYVFKTFSIKIFDYIVKPLSEEKFSVLFKRIIDSYTSNYLTLQTSYNSKINSVLINDIIYIESNIRHITVYTEDANYKFIGKLNDLEKKLYIYGFFRCHQGFLVNVKHIKEICVNDLITKNGVRIQISLRKKKKFVIEYFDFFSRGIN